jgi:hypothetical protein
MLPYTPQSYCHPTRSYVVSFESQTRWEGKHFPSQHVLPLSLSLFFSPDNLSLNGISPKERERERERFNFRRPFSLLQNNQFSFFADQVARRRRGNFDKDGLEERKAFKILKNERESKKMVKTHKLKFR